MPELTVFSRNTPAPVYDHPRPERLVSGNPLRTTFEHFSSADARLASGIWNCEPGAWRIAFAADRHEFFCIISGRIRIHDEHGMVAEFGPGDAGIIPANFAGTFEVIEAVSKHYFIVDQAS